ncbi:MAG: carbon-nitrogen hydrolase family protein [Dehalococcoidia bacterium]|nr:carbon-nitrogen hydrolase family protein [Dehalococcoidia bacterium]
MPELLPKRSPDPPLVTVGAVNWKGEWGNKAANLEKMKTKIREAARLGIDILCFPELALTGYECSEEDASRQGPCALHAEGAETIPGPSTEEIAGLARELDVYVIMGMPERDASDTQALYISAAVVGPEGMLGSYRKLHLATPPTWTEYYCFKPGNELPVFNTRFGPIGVQICADFWKYPEATRILTLKGAGIVFVPVGSASSPGKIDMMTHATAASGFQYVTYVVTANHVGRERALSYYGHSTIAGPRQPRLCAIYAQGGDDEEIVWATLSMKNLALSRKSSQVIERGNWRLFASEYQKLVDST